MAISYDFASGTAVSALSSSFTHVIANQSDRILMVGCAFRAGVASGVSVSYSGTGASQQSLTFYAGYNSSVQARTEIWYLVNPTVGSGTVTTTQDVIAKHAVTSVSYYGVDTASPFGSSGNSTATSSTPSITLTTVKDNSYIFNHIAIRSDARTFTASSPNTKRSDFKTTGSSATSNAHGVANDRTTTTLGSYTVSGTISASTEHVYQAVEIKPFVVTAFSQCYIIKPFK